MSTCPRSWDDICGLEWMRVVERGGEWLSRPRRGRGQTHVDPGGMCLRKFEVCGSAAGVEWVGVVGQ